MTTEPYKDLNDLEDAVNKADGVITVAAAVVRDAYGADRLGSHVRANIAQELRGRGLGHVPKDIPDRQWEELRIYKIASNVGTLIEAALQPGRARDESLREAAGQRADVLLSKIRELVCE